jgi:hypothetical protein
MREAERITLSLTGPSSHTLMLEPGVGSIALGPAGWRDPEPDLIVDADERIDWNAFDPFTVPAGYPWPRWFTYAGNDTGFLAWSTGREIERFRWTPRRAMDVDASRARINALTLTLRDDPLDIVLPEPAHPGVEVAVIGDARLFRPRLASGAECPRLRLVPDTRPSPDSSALTLPSFDMLGDATNVDVWLRPLRQPFDCASLLQFAHVRQLSLAGQLLGLPALAELPELTHLTLRYCPDLTGLPPLETWPRLSGLFASNVERSVGLRLRSEVKRRERASGTRWEHATVTELRTPEWFATEYGLPFSEWPRATARKAKTAYRAAEETVTTARSVTDVEVAIRTFTAALNALPDLYTLEREDAAEAVAQLAAKAPFDVGVRHAMAWFDAARDF